ncbi:alpha/beta-hydrolase [Aureobasidium pullulans]|uniref:Alpha/beta-hydrolase n=1 Tax=Aureobasidium pullulans TaxID=5580 RepID=A0A4T0C0Y9_AURPU|nr:alpha/beta-hydrolase [Aureobasidium pullulans]
MNTDSSKYVTDESAISSLGFPLYTKSWKPTGIVKARLVFVHGFSDHCNNPGVFFFPYLASHGIEVYAFDQRYHLPSRNKQQIQTDLTPNSRGFGRSANLPSQRGASGPTKTVLLDMTELLMTVLPSPYPVFLMGHSMGGQQVLYYGTQGPVSILQQLSGFIVEAPAIHLPDAPTGFLRLLLRYMAKMLPKFQMHAAPKPERLTRDPVRNAEIEADVLFHGYCTLEGMDGALERVDYNISAGCRQLGEATPMHEPSLLMLQGTADDVCLPSGAEEYFKKCPLKDKELKLYEGWLHELHGEVGEDKLTFARDVTYWILSHSK